MILKDFQLLQNELPAGRAVGRQDYDLLYSAPICPQKQNMVASVGSVHTVHSYLCVLVISAYADNQRPSVDGVDGIVHERVVSNKSDNIIWEVLGGSHIGCKGPSWASSRARIWNSTLIGYQLVIGSFLVGKRPVEYSLYIR